MSVHERGLGTDLSPGRRPRKSLLQVLALVLAMCMVAAACGSDDETADDAPATEAPAETSDAADEEPAAEEPAAEEPAEEPAAEEPAEEEPAAEEPAAAPSGDPIKIMATGTIESPAFSVPSTPVGAQIAVDEINAAGGVNGRPLELVVCNDELDPNVAAGCIQQAIEGGVVALVSGLSVFEPLVFPLLNEAGIPWIGMATSSDFSTPILFPIASDGVTAFSAVGYAAIEYAGCTNPAIFYSAQGDPIHGVNLSAGIEMAGGSVATILQGNGPDFGPLVESALAEGADCIATVTSPPETAGLIAANAGRLPLVSLDGPMPAGLVASLGNAADGAVIVAGHRLPAAGDPNVLALEEMSLAQYPDIELDNFWVHGYVGAQMVAQLLEGADDVSAATVLAGLPTVTDFDTGFGSSIDFSTPNSAAGYERIFNTEMFAYRVENGQYTIIDGAEFDMQPALEILSAG